MPTSNVIDKFILPTPNRGDKEFIVAIDNRGGYFAYEVGDLTQWAKVFGTEERNAHQLNPTVRRGNQYGTYRKLRPFASIHTARIAAQIQSQQHVQYF